MEIKIKNLLKILGLFLITIYTVFIPITSRMFVFESIVILLLSIYLVYKNKNNLPVMIIFIFFAYCIYSIVTGEYFTSGRLGVPLTEVKTEEIYGKTLRVLLLFIGWISILFPQIPKKSLEINLKNNSIVFYSLQMILIYIGLFGVNRVSGNVYSVQIKSIYEYSTILFAFSYYYSGNIKARKILWTGILLFFVIQDYYYGGRITSLQLIMIALLTFYKNYLSKINILVVSFVGMFVNQIVAFYRTSLLQAGISLKDIFGVIKNDMFVFDTPVYAYYSSATHVAAADSFWITTQERLSSFVDFFISIFIGGSRGEGNVTYHVATNYFNNVGGGIYPSHFYFWFGYVGVILGVLLLIIITTKLIQVNTDYSKLLLIAVLYSTPRWLLYNPLNLYRTLFFVSVIYLAIYLSRKGLKDAI